MRWGKTKGIVYEDESSKSFDGIYCRKILAEKKKIKNSFCLRAETLILKMRMRRGRGEQYCTQASLTKDHYGLKKEINNLELIGKLLTGSEQSSQCVQSYPVDFKTRQTGYMVCQTRADDRC